MQQGGTVSASRTLMVLGGVTAVSYGAEILITRAGIIEGGFYLDWINGFLIAITFSGIWYAGIRAAAREIMGKGFAAVTGLFCIVILMALAIGILANGYRPDIFRMHEVRGFGDAASFGLLTLTLGVPVFYATGPFLLFGGGLLIVASVHHIKLFRRWGILAGAAGCIAALRYGLSGPTTEPRGSYWGFALALTSVVIGAITVWRQHVKRTADHE